MKKRSPVARSLQAFRHKVVPNKKRKKLDKIQKKEARGEMNRT